MKKIIQIPILFMIILLITSCSKEEEITFLEAKSEHWNAKMAVTFDDSPVTNHIMDTTFIYEGSEGKTSQKVTYQTIQSANNNVYSEFTSDFLPTEEKPFQKTLASTNLLGNYAIGLKLKIIVIWNESGSRVQEELLFEIVYKDH